MEPVRKEDEIFADLAELCASPGFVHVIAFFCSRDNLIRFSEQVTAEDFEHQYSHSRLVRTEISTLIGLLMRADIDETLPAPDEFQAMIDRAEALLEELHDALAAPWREAFNPETKALVRDPFGDASGLREPIFYGGESGHGFQYRDLAVPKYAADNDWLFANRGFRIEDAKAVATALGDLQTEQQMAIEKGLREKPPAEWTVLPGFIFEAANLASRSGIDLDLIHRVLDAFSLPAGHRNDSFTSLNAFNATNATPIIRRGDGSYLLLQHYSLQEAIYETPFFWMSADKTYAPTALTHRGLFTEAFASACLTRVFGPHRVFRNVHILRPDGNRLGEIDVLVLFGDIAVVVQAKSKRLTIEARKGNDLQLKDDFKKAIQDASDQAFLCADALITPGFKLVDEVGNDLGISRPLKTIFPLCLVSDHYPALAFQARYFLASKTTSIIQGPLVTDVFALDVMAEMLPSPLHFLHYLNMRAQFGERLMMSHELTLLSFHLKYNLWFDDTYNMMSLGDDFAADLDIAMLARREGLPGAKTPDGILTRLANTATGRLIAEIEAREDPPAVQLGLWLLQLNEDTHRSLGAGLDRIASDARRDGENHDMTIAAGEPSSGLTMHCSYRDDDEAAERLLAHCHIRKHSQKADRWFGLLLDPDTQGVRLGVVVDAPWEDDAQLDALVAQMPQSRPVWEFKHPGLRRKIGRNEPCPCGSGKKFKKCCL